MGGGSNGAARQAQQNQDQRNAQIATSTNQINSIFDSPARTGQYAQLAKDTTGYYTNQLNQQKAINDRSMKFSLARNGQEGGSVQADQATQAGKDYLNGVLDATRRGNQASAGLQAQDQTSRANLIAMAQGGLDTTQAASQAASALKSNLDSGQSASTSNAFGNTFGDFASIYQQSQAAAAARNGYNTGYQTGQGFGYQPGFGGGYGPQQQRPAW